MKKTIAIILVAIIALSAFAAVATVSAKPFMNWRNLNRGHGWWNRTNLQTNHVRLTGVIDQWGSTEVYGLFHAQSRTWVINTTDTRQGSTATAVWTTNDTRPINSVRAKENFTYVFYTARLLDPDVAALDVDSSDFFMNGTWNVFNITSTFNVYTDANGNITVFHREQDGVALATQAYGELNVTGTWTSFTLDIDGVDTLSGSVRAHRITAKMFNPFKSYEDSSEVLTSADVASVAQSYGAMPGWGNYDQSKDYNFDYKIDICDLTTAAANINI